MKLYYYLAKFVCLRLGSFLHFPSSFMLNNWNILYDTAITYNHKDMILCSFPQSLFIRYLHIHNIYLYRDYGYIMHHQITNEKRLALKFTLSASTHTGRLYNRAARENIRMNANKWFTDVPYVKRRPIQLNKNDWICFKGGINKHIMDRWK